MRSRPSVNFDNSPLGKKQSYKSSKNPSQNATGKKSQFSDDPLGALVDEMEKGKTLENVAGRSD